MTSVTDSFAAVFNAFMGTAPLKPKEGLNEPPVSPSLAPWLISFPVNLFAPGKTPKAERLAIADKPFLYILYACLYFTEFRGNSLPTILAGKCSVINTFAQQGKKKA